MQRRSRALIFSARYHLANGLMRLSLATLPSDRCREDLRAILRAYSKGVTAAVLLREMENIVTFKGDEPPDLKVDAVLGIAPP